jgi:hypothetical protein
MPIQINSLFEIGIRKSIIHLKPVLRDKCRPDGGCTMLKPGYKTATKKSKHAFNVTSF